MLPLRWTSAPPLGPGRASLRQPGSLTARLARSGVVSVEVIASGWHRASADEAAVLGLPRAGMRVYARLVCVRRDDQAQVLARSVTTVTGLRRCWRRLRQLGRQPLATLLWTDPRIRRSGFEYARLPATHPLARAVAVESALPARRSMFYRDGEALVVMEAFAGLPWPTAGWTSRRRRWAAPDR